MYIITADVKRQHERDERMKERKKGEAAELEARATLHPVCEELVLSGAAAVFICSIRHLS